MKNRVNPNPIRRYQPETETIRKQLESTLPETEKKIVSTLQIQPFQPDSIQMAITWPMTLKKIAIVWRKKVPKDTNVAVNNFFNKKLDLVNY